MDFYNLKQYTLNAVDYCHTFIQKKVQRNQGPFVVLIMGIALHIFRFRYPVSYPFIGYSLGFFLGRQIIDYGKQHKIFLLNRSSELLRSLMSKAPVLRIYFLLLSLSFIRKAPNLTMTSALFSGVLAAAQQDIVKTPKDPNRRITKF